MKRIIVFGDSLTQEGFSIGGWVQQLANRYVRRADVLNRGFSGYNSRWALELLDDLNVDEEVVLGTVFLGANDAATGTQHVPVEEYEKNLETIVSHFLAKGCEKIILIAPPPLAPGKYVESFLKPRGRTEVDRSNEAVAKYVEACQRVGSKLKVPVLNSFEVVNEAANNDVKELDKFFNDGLHFNAEGNTVIFNKLLAVIEEAYPSLVVTPCKFTGNIANSGSSCPDLDPFGPWWDQINPEAKPGTFIQKKDEKEPSSKKQKTG